MIYREDSCIEVILHSLAKRMLHPLEVRSVWSERYDKGRVVYFEGRIPADDKRELIVTFDAETRKAREHSPIVMLDILNHESESASSFYHYFKDNKMAELGEIGDNTRILSHHGVVAATRYELITQTNVTIKYLGLYLCNQRMLTESEQACFVDFMHRAVPHFVLTPRSISGWTNYFFNCNRQDAYTRFVEQATMKYASLR